MPRLRAIPAPVACRRCACWSSTTTTRSSTTSCSTSVSSARSRSSTATTPSPSTSCARSSPTPCSCRRARAVPTNPATSACRSTPSAPSAKRASRCSACASATSASARSSAAQVVRAPHVMHGKTSQITHDGRGVFAGLPRPFTATRYHSLVVERESVPDVLEISAESEDGLVMGLRHRELPIEGVQFHPESILTEAGHSLLGNFLGVVRVTTPRAGAARPAHHDREAVVDERGQRRRRRAPVPRADPARSRAITSPRRCRKLPANGAWRWRVSSGSGPRVAHRRRSGHSAHRGSRGRHNSAPTSINASSRSRPRSGRPMRTVAASAGAFREPRAADPLDDPTDVHLDRRYVDVVGLGHDRGRGVAPDAGQLASGRRATRGRAARPRCRTSGAPGAGTRAGPTPSITAPGPASAMAVGVGKRARKSS